MTTAPSIKSSTGLTYIEVLIAVVLIAVALVPAIEAIHIGVLGSEVSRSTSDEHYRALALMEEVLAKTHTSLVVLAATTADSSTPNNLSDAAGISPRRLVYVALYDANNEDGDDDVFTVVDPNLDSDGDVYTNYTGLIWVRVAVEGSVATFDSLVAP